MATYISTFRVNQDGLGLTIIASTDSGETIQSLKIWNQDSYKDYTKALDFSSKLVQTTNTESITITASELSESKLNGIYFVELVDSTSSEECAGCNNTRLGVATDFSRFSYCIIDYLCKMENCCNCNEELNRALTMKLYMDQLRNSLQLGNFTTAIKFWKNLNRACKPECEECNSITSVSTKGLGFQTLNNELILY